MEKSISSETRSDFQSKLRDTLNRSGRKGVAIEYTRSPKFVKDYGDLSYGEAFRRLWGQLRAVVDPSLEDAKKATSSIFELDPRALSERTGFRSDKERLSDSLVAAKVLSRGDLSRLDDVVAALRLVDIIERIAREDETLGVPGAVKQALERKVRMPTASVQDEAGAQARLLAARMTAAAAAVNEDASKVDRQAKELSSRLEMLETSIRVLGAVLPEAYVRSETATRSIPFATSLRDEVLGRLREAFVPSAAASKAARSGRGARAHEPTTDPLVLRRQTVEQLPEPIKTVLRDYKIDLEKTPLLRAVSRLEEEVASTGLALAKLATPGTISVTRVGKSFMTLTDKMALKGMNGEAQPAFLPELHPSGTGDLLVVKQSIKRYEAGEVGHIENVLKGEVNERTVRRARTTEETTLQEIERTQQEERDLQSTEHFELKREVDKTVKEDGSLKAGATLSGSYGGTIDFKTYIDGALSTSQTESIKQASSYAKDVTTRSASKVSERVRQQITRRSIEQFEEQTKHAVDNTAGADHVSGIYQWVDKIYEAQVWNYGTRLLFDIMVPEPAAFFIEALMQKKLEGEALEKPTPFTLAPNEITEGNYFTYVARYGVTGVEPPPPLFRTLAKAFDERSNDGNPKTKSVELTIETGYTPSVGFVAWTCTPGTSGSTPIVTALISKHSLIHIGWDFSESVALNGEEGQISIGFCTINVKALALTIEITCLRTSNHLYEWQLKTHAAIQQAYLKMVSDHEQKLANLKAQAFGIQGHNPARNRAIEKNELKRSALAILTRRGYEKFDAVDESSPGTGVVDHRATPQNDEQ
ncbi:hypothetical protein [Sorangium sp. So ce1151]|uniref:hypothetical protein n=1 Tax=Sorangium sp. So ce1151 TaxID=3133332 RepID=UPI003F63872E